MSTTVAAPRYTPESLLLMPDGDRYELVNGQLVERNMGFKSARIGGELYGELRNHCRNHGLGWVLPADVGFCCFPDDPNRLRKPDVAFISKDRLPADQEPVGHCTIAPDLVAQVVSPNDLAEMVTEKVEEYLTAGVRLVWVLHPGTQTIQIYRADGTTAWLRASEELTGEGIVPGFRCRVADLFLPPPGTLG